MTPRAEADAFRAADTTLAGAYAALGLESEPIGGAVASSVRHRSISSPNNRCTTAGSDRLVANQLLSEDVAEWREAQFRLASAGPAGLEAIDDPYFLSANRGTLRAYGVIRLALLLSVSWEQMQAHPRLLAVIRDSVARATDLVASIPRRADVDKFYGSVLGDSVGASSPDPVQQAMSLGGCAVPALLAKLHDPKPAERASACMVLGQLSSISEIEHVDSLATDNAAFDWDHGDYSTRASVSQVARSIVAALRARRLSPYRYETPIYLLALSWDLPGDGSVLINGIRESSQSLKANNWDAWWAAARPAWSDWWRLAGQLSRPPDYGPWDDAMDAYRGYRLVRRANALGRVDVTITGPPGTQCKLVADSTQLAVGPVPLRFVRIPDSTIVQLEQEAAKEGRVVWRTFDVEALLPNGRHWKGSFFWHPSESWTINVMAEPRRPGQPLGR